MQDYKNTLVENIPYLRRYARALTDNMRLADRMVQQCIDCATDLHQLIKNEQNNVIDQKLWLFSIFHNIHTEFIEEQQAITAELSINDSPDSAESAGTAERDEYYRAFIRLPLQQKQIFLLVSVEKFLYEDVSKIVNMPLGAILSLLHTARNSIAEQVYSAPAGRATESPAVTDNTPGKSAANNNDEAVELSL
jgi:RNA polymerase sigma-70 factor (ECF subfamily)